MRYMSFDNRGGEKIMAANATHKISRHVDQVSKSGKASISKKQKDYAQSRVFDKFALETKKQKIQSAEKISHYKSMKPIQITSEKIHKHMQSSKIKFFLPSEIASDLYLSHNIVLDSLIYLKEKKIAGLSQLGWSLTKERRCL
jgi:hypothetical protein